MTILIYNTLTRSKEEFKPLIPGLVRMYVCGPTPYDHTHIGHARTYVAFDLIRRFLELEGFTVVHVMNITDIDDKIIRKARETVGLDRWREVPEEYTKEFFEVMDRLRVKRPHYTPRVTEHIEDIIEMVRGLIEKGYAYVSSGSVYFDVDKYGDYGGLSKVRDRSSWRQEEEFLAEKKRPYDFALWKRAKPGEPYWDSPWGPGRPGWHVECSVMSSKYLGSQFDIHGGGQDLIFPHHENERAQSEAYFGVKPWVRYWVHVGYLTIRGEKMSKSLGNIIPVAEVFKKYPPEALKLYLISAHYRSPLDFSWEGLDHALRTYRRLRNLAENLIANLKTLDVPSKSTRQVVEDVLRVSKLKARFTSELRDDFNTAKALPHLFSMVSLVNKRISEGALTYPLAVKALEFLEYFNALTGVLDEVLGKRAELATGIVDRLISLIVEVRALHRRRGDYDIADWIRSELAKLGVRLIDQRDRTVWILEQR